MREIVVDTNVFVSALLTPRGIPRKLLTEIAAGKVGLVILPFLLLEIVSVFSRPKLRLLVPESEISEMTSLIHWAARVVKPVVVVTACRDPKDNAVLECALAGKVSAVVSGDKDLLELNPFRGISVVTPKDFMSSLKSKRI